MWNKGYFAQRAARASQVFAAISIATAACLALFGCEAPSLVVLQDPATGQIIPCGPTPDAPSANPAADAQSCAATYEGRGYYRLPAETPPAE